MPQEFEPAISQLRNNRFFTKLPQSLEGHWVKKILEMEFLLFESHPEHSDHNELSSTGNRTRGQLMLTQLNHIFLINKILKK